MHVFVKGKISIAFLFTCSRADEIYTLMQVNIITN
jgi:hypothetical protein